MTKLACESEIQDFSFCHMNGETIVIPSGVDQMQSSRPVAEILKEDLSCIHLDPKNTKAMRMPFNISSHLLMPPFNNEPDADWDEKEVDQFEGQPDSP